MKRKIIGLLALRCVCICAFAGCSDKKYDIIVPEHTLGKNGGSLRVAVASDLHTGATAVVSTVFEGNYSTRILDAFIQDLVDKEVDILVLSGDISNSARNTHHTTLTEKLRTAEEKGIEVYVIPGNHDIGEVTVDGFAEYYADFGYSQALTRDTDSLSYACVVGNTMLVMLDTDGYTDYRYANLSRKTISWIKSVFDTAQTNNLTILPVGHYPVIIQHTTEVRGGDRLLEMLKYYNVPLYISGHLHNRNVNTRDGITELVVEQLTTYPCSYALLDIDRDGDMYYHPERLDISAWAASAGITDQLLLNFEQLGQKSAEENNRSLVDTLSQKHYASARDKKKRYEFFLLLSQCMADGTIYTNKDTLLSHPGYAIFMRICQDSNYAPWIPVLFENSNPYTEGFAIKAGQLTTLD